MHKKNKLESTLTLNVAMFVRGRINLGLINLCAPSCPLGEKGPSRDSWREKKIRGRGERMNGFRQKVSTHPSLPVLLSGGSILSQQLNWYRFVVNVLLELTNLIQQFYEVGTLIHLPHFLDSETEAQRG